MSQNKLQDGIVVRTEKGDFKLFKNNRMEELPSDALMVPQDDLTVPYNKIIESKEPKVKTNFYISVDDELEVSRERDVESEDRNKKIGEYINNTVEKIIYQVGFEIINLQVKNIITSCLRDVRTVAEAKEALKRENIAEDLIEKLIKLVIDERQIVEKVIKGGDIPKSVEVKHKAKIVQNEIDELSDNVGKQKKIIDNMAGVEYRKEPKVVEGHEITSHITTGPVEELKELDLKEFRRLGENPKEAAMRIMDKIDLLEDESLLKKADGIRAWHSSQVYKLYLEIGAASMSQRKPIEQIIREYKEAGKDYLAPEEFNIVADLNSKLTY